MLDTRTNEWLARLQANGPTYVSFALAALIVVELARGAVFMLSGPVKSPEPIAGQVPPTHPRSGVDAQSVVSAHLFGVAVADPTTQDPNNAPLSSASLVLAGTIATQDPRHGVAIISDGGPSKVYSVGENVNGASLHSVYLDHVILDRGGVLETLLLPRLLGNGNNRQAAPRHAGADPRTVAAVDNIRRMVQQDPSILDQVMRTVASYDNVAGKLRGFRAYPGRNRAIFAKLGLKPGDLVTAINGTQLDDPQHSQEVFNTIQTSDSVNVTIERGGQKQELSLNIAQVAAQASKDLDGDSNGAAGSTTQSATPSGAPPGGAPPSGTPPNSATPNGAAPNGAPPGPPPNGAGPPPNTTNDSVVNE
jgi:general secretion pathway protein C